MEQLPGLRHVTASAPHDVPHGARPRLTPILEASFQGIYRWHALRTLPSVQRVRAIAREGADVGLTMFEMLGPGLGYVYYVAVHPGSRGAGVGGALLDDALAQLRGSGAREVLACIRPENTSSIHLFSSRGFTATSFRETARLRGLGGTLGLWRRMVVAPGERVYRAAPA
ncbi:MAG TPA: N-acetyltransferase [Spirochaetia bacterium]|nr:N-acetyltransferase [Spirochaetia bacterium]